MNLQLHPQASVAPIPAQPVHLLSHGGRGNASFFKEAAIPKDNRLAINHVDRTLASRRVSQAGMQDERQDALFAAQLNKRLVDDLPSPADIDACEDGDVGPGGPGAGHAESGGDHGCTSRTAASSAAD